MLNVRCLILVFVIIFQFGCENGSSDKVVPLTGTWQANRGPIFPGLGGRLVSFVVGSGDTTFYGLGAAHIDEELNDFWMFTPSGWKEVAPFPGRTRMNAIGFVIGGKAYVGLGQTHSVNGRYKDFWVYDSRQDAWDSVRYEFPGRHLLNGVAFSVGGKGYVGTGRVEGGEYSGDFYEFDPKNGWKSLPAAIVDRQAGATAFVVDGAAYLCFGQEQSYCREVLKFLPAEGRWKSMASLRADRYPSIVRTGARSFVLREKEGEFAYVIGGRPEKDSPEAFWSCCRYDPRKDKWEQVNAPDLYLDTPVTFSAGGVGYLLDGVDMWKFIP